MTITAWHNLKKSIGGRVTLNMNEISLNMIANLKVAKASYAETFLYASTVVSEHQLQHYKQQFMHRRRSKRTQSLTLTEHALQRWNERIGPNVRYDELENRLHSIVLLQPWRIHKVAHNIWTIDEDIVFIANMDNGHFTIVTFLGRIMLKPVLKNIKALQGYVTYKRDRLNLVVSEDVVAQQSLPILPQKIWHVQGSTTDYWLEWFDVTFDEEPIILCSVYNAKTQHYECYFIHLSKPQQRVLHRKVLNVLYKWGFYEFLHQYYEHFDQSKIQKIALRMKRKVEKRLTYINVPTAR